MESGPKTANRVFIDSSVLIAAAISSAGAGRELLIRGMRGDVQLFISPLVLEETERNLRAKAPAALPAFAALQEALAARSVNPTKAAVRQASKHITAKDAPIVAAARLARAPYLATYGQKDVLNHRDLISAHFGIQVVFTDEILKMLRPKDG